MKTVKTEQEVFSLKQVLEENLSTYRVLADAQTLPSFSGWAGRSEGQGETAIIRF